MLIKKCTGYELEKEQSNTSEDFFNRSEITYEEDGVEKTLHVLYVRYFDQLFTNFTPYEQDPIFTKGSKELFLKDIVALACLITNPGNRHRKRVYISSEREFSAIFANLNFEKLEEVFSALSAEKTYKLDSPLKFVLQQQ